MNQKNLNESFWNNHYLERTTGWDLKQVSPPLKEFINQLTDKNLRILIPGCGNSYEAAYLLEKGFTDITIIDIAPALVESLKNKFSNDSRITIVLQDFFDHEGTYDLVLEQTFFCAIDPSLRPQYIVKMSQLLKKGGKLAGLLFNRDFEDGPPFGGSKKEYLALFSPDFNIKIAETAYNSFEKRKGSELFISMIRK
jgi:SAM-dependent methyltransferase